ncbi:NYN domain-containing protein [Isoptericola sp. 4D.3]|uniref:NYN domain-containing protein n=1 Tax=Isoptericola peretonis TaxID=2918523 RepID=A0ABT0J4C9_9MICO|nr:NYN domain-containing protein [Isoptericola sp. 4D.3]
MDTEERLAVFLDYENLALGARDHLGGMQFDFKPIADALAVRGRVVVRRAYADWSYFDEDRRMLTRHQVELIEMTQRMGASRKNAADIKMVVDAIEMAFEREYITTFVMCTGDSDFSPLVHKLRELDKRVIGVGVENSTSRLLPSACDEFLFYDRLEGVDVPDESEAPAPKRTGRGAGKGTGRAGGGRGGRAKAPAVEVPAEAPAESPAEPAVPAVPVDEAPASGTSGTRRRRKAPAAEVAAEPAPEPAVEAVVETDLEHDDSGAPGEDAPMEVKVAQTLADLQASTSGSVTASMLKRTLVRKDPTFSESDYGFRTFGEFLRFLADRGFVVLAPGPSTGDPEVALPEQQDTAGAFGLLRQVVQGAGGTAPLSGLKNEVRKRRPDFSEKALGYRGFLQFAKAAAASDAVGLAWDDDAEDYLVTVA